MPGEENKDPVDMKSVEAAIGNIAKTIDEKISGFAEKLEGVNQRMTEMQEVRKSVMGETQDEPEPEADDDEPLTKKDIKKIIPRLKEEAKKEATGAALASLEHKTNRQSRDNEAVADFPMLNRKGAEHNSEFEQEVVREMNRRVAAGRDSKDLDLLYDAASVVFSKWTRAGKYAPRSAAEREAREMDSREDSFSVSGKRKTDSTKPNERQMNLAKRLNMNTERFTKNFGK